MRLAPLLLLAACGLGRPELPALDTAPQLVEVTPGADLATGGTLPSDLVARPAGGWAVLDSLRERALLFDADGTPDGELSGEAWTRGVRAALSDDGASWWMASPDDHAVLRLDLEGAVLERHELATAEGIPLAPVAVADLGVPLLVGTRTGELVMLDGDGTTVSTVAQDVDGEPLGSIADLLLLPDGRIAAVDTLGPRIHLLDAEGRPTSWSGEMGPWIGYLLKPKSVAAGPDGTFLVADSYQGAVQLFDADGTALGALAVDGEPVDFRHPIAVAGTGPWAVLDQADGRLWSFDLPLASVEAARATAEVRHLRTALVAPRGDDAESDARLCLQCHDGVVNDDREVWDPALGHHPVGVVPDLVEVPEAFPLDGEGRIRCGTCHSPHGISELGELDAEEDLLVRHSSGQTDLFTRARRSDSSLCIGCHTDAAHDQIVEALALPRAGTHPVGQDLVDALAARGGETGDLGLPAGIDGSCLSCHAVHAAGDGALQRGLADGGTCLGCHPDRVGADHHALVSHESARTDGPEACLACHDLVGGLGEALVRFPEGRDPCTSCHEAPRLGAAHAGLRSDAGPCTSCHSPHFAEASPLLGLPATRTRGDAHGCTSCHDDGRHGRAGHPVSAKIACTGCHANAHAPSEVPTCGRCHEAQQAAAARGGHGGAACQDCHPVHEDLPAFTAGPAHLNPASRTCLACHAPGRDGSSRHVAAFEHPSPLGVAGGERWEPLGELPLYDASGRVLPAGENGELVCQSCHTLHGPHPTEPGDKLRRPGWKEACSSCHGQDGLVLYRWFHAPQRRAGLGGTP